jgi:arylsulfatase A
MPHMAMRYNNYTLIGRFPIKTDSLTLMEWMKTSTPISFELYNLANDPEQQINLVTIQPEMAEKLKPIMIKQWINIRDEGPNWEKINADVKN